MKVPHLADAAVPDMKDVRGVLVHAVAAALGELVMERDGVLVSADHVVESDLGRIPTPDRSALSSDPRWRTTDGDGRWLRDVLARSPAVAGIARPGLPQQHPPLWALTATNVGGGDLALSRPRGAWVAVYF